MHIKTCSKCDLFIIADICQMSENKTGKINTMQNINILLFFLHCP